MNSLDSILSNPNKFYTVPEVARALRTTPQLVDFHIRRGNMEYVYKPNRRRYILGKWVRDFLINVKKNKRFLSLREILKDYELPTQRDGK
jgi:hypothetical protein